MKHISFVSATFLILMLSKFGKVNFSKERKHTKGIVKLHNEPQWHVKCILVLGQLKKMIKTENLE